MLLKICWCVLFLVVIFIAVCKGQIALANGKPIKDALFLHNTSITNNTKRDCTWRPANDDIICPDPDVHFILYSGGKREVADLSQSDWLRQSAWDSTKEDVFIIHGYAGGDNTLPIVVLKDAYITNGSYNVWMVDWGALAEPPCYPAAVHNMRSTARCTAHLLTSLRTQGLRTDKLTCIGHSLGAHTCGLISKHVMFRLNRIVGLDPARPLVPAASRLSSSDASAVHILHTNAGHYGEGGRGGHVDFCINGGRVQPFCENSGRRSRDLARRPGFTVDEQLCSHVWAVCYMAESINTKTAKRAEPCSRRCPTGPRPGHRIGVPVFMGQHTPLTTTGSYCVYDTSPPYCPKSPEGPGDKRCCLQIPKQPTSTTTLPPK